MKVVNEQLCEENPDLCCRCDDEENKPNKYAGIHRSMLLLLLVSAQSEGVIAEWQANQESFQAQREQSS